MKVEERQRTIQRISLKCTHEPRKRSGVQHFKASHGADCVLSFRKSTLQILTRLTLTATYRGRYCYHPQVTHEKTEAQISNLPNVSQWFHPGHLALVSMLTAILLHRLQRSLLGQLQEGLP